jgi:hypothetical protein
MPVSLTLRNTKGSALTFTEMDTNLSNLKTAVDAVDSVTFVTTSTTQTVTGAKTFNTVTLKDIRESIYAFGTTSGTIAPNASTASVFTITLNGTLTMNAFTSPQAGQSVTMIVAQDGTGSRTLSSTMKFAGSSKTLTTTATTGLDVINIFYDGTNYLASLVKGFA